MCRAGGRIDKHVDGGTTWTIILIEARILAVADAMEYLTTNKSYRGALTIEQALKKISEESGARFDPGVVAACLRLFKEKNMMISLLG
jgi:HD-GYP domain-containing protein (c-di-GMP phosphodiesterase class II)